MLYTEISILKGLDHPNVVRLFEFFEDETRLYLITDLC
jgi:calcium-dependent protein kinase